MHLTTLLAASLLPALPYARSIPSCRGVDCSFYTTPDSGATCATFADGWGMSEDDLKALNSGINCPDIDTQNTYCVIGSVNDDPDEPSPTATPSKSTAPVSTKVTSAIKTTPTALTPTVTQKPTTTKQPSGNAVGRECELLWAGTNACVGVIGSTPSLTTTTKPKPATTTVKGNGIKTPEPIQEGMVSNCNKWHFVGETTTCLGIVDYNKITMADFIKWNPAVGKDCDQLWKGTNACVGVVGSTPKPTPTAPSNGIKTPLPIQVGMVKNCVTFHYISSTTTCQALLKYRKITMEQFVKWNPAVKKDCSGLWKDTNACVGVK
ncbi:hypothetical protein NW768_011823 [Fusarium equiseti]|uniref:LysM domain-containing protein n=1 Tax=Fusarium equiseti TaxID=61235 RepID=A0ABQ8QWE4_FUSEQ|nr:hypothetical protein NW768_011823 [Fusarium equiseti]